MPNKIHSLDQLLSDDIWLYLLEFCEDYDLHQLEKVSPRFKILSTDTILWRHITSLRSKSRVSNLLERPQRPKRTELAKKGILEGVSQRSIEEGVYINNGNCGIFNQRVKEVNRMLLYSVLRKKLDHRPDLDTLSQRNLIPVEAVLHHPPAPPARHEQSLTGASTMQVEKEISVNSSDNPSHKIHSCDGNLSSSLVPTLVSLRKNLILDQLNQHLKKRVPFEKIMSVSKGIIFVLSECSLNESNT